MKYKVTFVRISKADVVEIVEAGNPSLAFAKFIKKHPTLVTNSRNCYVEECDEI